MSVWARLARGRGPSETRQSARECVTHHIRHKKPPLSPAPRLSRIAAQYTDALTPIRPPIESQSQFAHRVRTWRGQ